MAAYQERVPHERLRPFATVSWSYRVQSDRQRAAFVPHGFPDLLWIDGKPWLGGTYSRAVIEQGERDAVVVGVALRPGVIAAWTGIAAADLLGLRVPLASVLPDLSSRLIDAVAEESDPARIVARIEETIVDDLAHLEAPSTTYAVIRRALREPGSAKKTTRQIAEALGTTERTFRRHCTTLFGYGPKTLERVLRAQRFLDFASRSASAGIAALSDAAGYSDQAHLTRETRVLTGLTPKAIVDQYEASRAVMAETFNTVR